jgi:phage terminase small subunit
MDTKDAAVPAKGGGLPNLPLHTNKAIAMQKAKRSGISKKQQAAIDSGNVQAVIDSLTPMQLLFVEEFLKDPSSATDCALKAGYAPTYANRQAYQLKENPAVRIAIDALRAERNRMADVTKDYVLQKIVKALEDAERDEQKNYTAILRAAELLARHLGMFVDKTEISGPDGKEIEIKQKQVKEEADSFVDLIDRTAKKMGGLSAVE